MKTVNPLKQLHKLVDLKSLSPADARREIAKDVLAGLALKKFTPRRGVYFEALLSNAATLQRYSSSESNSLREFVPSFTQCNVCALGSLFLAKVARVNECELHLPSSTTFVGSQNVVKEGSLTITQQLRDFFSRTQLDAIERAFEGRSVAISELRFGSLSPLQRAAMKFYIKTRAEDHRGRLEAIMKNIVANGEFQP